MKIPGPDHPITITPAAQRWRAMFQGHVIAEGDAHAIVQNEQVRRVYLGSSFGEGITEEEERGLELD